MSLTSYRAAPPRVKPLQAFAKTGSGENYPDRGAANEAALPVAPERFPRRRPWPRPTVRGVCTNADRIWEGAGRHLFIILSRRPVLSRRGCGNRERMPTFAAAGRGPAVCFGPRPGELRPNVPDPFAASAIQFESAGRDARQQCGRPRRDGNSSRDEQTRMAAMTKSLRRAAMSEHDRRIAGCPASDGIRSRAPYPYFDALSSREPVSALGSGPRAGLESA